MVAGQSVVIFQFSITTDQRPFSISPAEWSMLLCLILKWSAPSTEQNPAAVFLPHFSKKFMA